jgi:hypothetical protein
MKVLVSAIAVLSLLMGSMCLAQTQKDDASLGAPTSRDSNEAVISTNADQPTPAAGANSFTEDQARSRLEARGYSVMSGLEKDDSGIWRGKGQKNGGFADVWVDYKGNVGETK